MCGWQRKGEGRDRPSNEELVSDLGLGLSLECPVIQFLHLKALFLPTLNSREEPQSSQLRLNYNNDGELDHFT